METLEPLPADRRCFRMINGVLVERTVGEVVPALKTNSEGLKKVLDDLLKQYKSKQDEMEKWKVSLPELQHLLPRTPPATCLSRPPARRSPKLGTNVLPYS